MAAPCREALARRASQSTVSCGQPSAGISVEEFLYLFSHTHWDSFLRPLSFYSRGAMLGETGRDVRNKDPALLKKPRNLTRITIEVEDLSGNPNPNLSVFSIQLSRRSLPYSASPHSNPLSLTPAGSEESMMTPARPQARRHQTVVLS